MVLNNIITWDDVIGNKSAWSILVWFATLVALAAGLKEVGILTWISQKAELFLMDLTPTILMISMIVASFGLHYFFANLIAHAVALFPICVALSVKFISPEQLTTFLILFSGTLGIMGIITPSIWYGSGYISQSRWWFLGAIFGGLYLGTILLGVLFFLIHNF